MKNTKNNLRKLLNIFAIFVILFSTVSKLYKFQNKYKSTDTYESYKVKIIERMKSSEDKLSYLVKYNNDKFVLNIYKSKYSKENLNLGKYAKYTYGDYIVIKGKIRVPELLNNPYEFDYKRYLNSKNVYAVINTYSAPKFKYNKRDILSYVYDFKTYISDIINR